jgi:hypothetical protein
LRRMVGGYGSIQNLEKEPEFVFLYPGKKADRLKAVGPPDLKLSGQGSSNP